MERDKKVNNFQGSKFGGGFAGRDYTGDVTHTHSDASLNETVKNIETLIKDLSQNQPTNTTSQQMLIATQAIETIENNLDWK